MEMSISSSYNPDKIKGLGTTAQQDELRAYQCMRFSLPLDVSDNLLALFVLADDGTYPINLILRNAALNNLLKVADISNEIKEEALRLLSKN